VLVENRQEVSAPQSEFPLKSIEVIFVVSAVGAILAHIVRFAGIPEIWDWWLPLMVLLAFPVADLVSGVVHWLGDTWGHADTPLVGRNFIRPFRFHHTHPLDMLNSHFFTTNSDPAMISLFFLLPAFALPLDTAWGRVVAVFVVAFTVWGLPTSQFHKWAHMKNPPLLVGWLQRRGLILSPEHHWRHHKSPFLTNYCIVSGWCDRVLNVTRFFPALEWLVSRVTGLAVRPDDAQAPSQVRRTVGTHGLQHLQATAQLNFFNGGRGDQVNRQSHLGIGSLDDIAHHRLPGRLCRCWP